MISDTDRIQRNLGGVMPYLNLQGLDVATATLADAAAAAQAEFERITTVLLETTRIVMNPPSDYVLGTDYDLEDQPHVYHHLSGKQPLRLTTHWRPIQSIQSFRLEFQRGAELFSVPSQWERMDKRMGVITIIPYMFSAAMASSAAAAVGLSVLGGINWVADAVPDLIAFDYTAGYTDTATNPRKADILNCLAWMAAANVLRDIRRLIPNSGTLPGFTESYDSVQQQIDDLDKRAAMYMAAFKKLERPIVAGML